jgi:hypothetical protein
LPNNPDQLNDEYMKYWHLNTLLLVLFSLFLSQCEDELYLEDQSAKLRFSEDTVFFDTVFTTIGTTTQSLKFYNPYNKSLLISEIYLAKGSNSVFRLNIDGEPVFKVENKKIGPKDSLYIFIEATVDPNGGNLPLLVRDSIVFITNNNLQDVKLMAWGQDVHYFRNEIIKTQTWQNDKPYLIYDAIQLDSNEILTIEAGVRVYMHWQAFIAIEGTLIINGTAEEPVTFQYDRLEEGYKDEAGQWNTIALVGSNGQHVIKHAIVKNALIGFQVGHPCNTKTVSLLLQNTQIINSKSVGIYAFGADITAYNSIIANSGAIGLAALKGGKYNFYHCTFAGRTSSIGNILLSNFSQCYDYKIDSSTFLYTDTSYLVYKDLESAYFANSIINGPNIKRSELVLSKDDAYGFNYFFDHCLMTLNPDSMDVNDKSHFNEIILNKAPKFKDIENANMELDTLSPAKDQGSYELIRDIPALLKDLNGKPRDKDMKPDLGAHERIEE